jgi:hypothetical protein
MSETDQEIEATRTLSLEIARQSERLADEVLDPAKQLEPLFRTLDQEVQRLAELSSQRMSEKNAMECRAAAANVIADWSEMEVVARQEGRTDEGKPAGTSSRPAPQRGMRV